MYNYPYMHAYPPIVYVPVVNDHRHPTYWTIPSEVEHVNQFGYLRANNPSHLNLKDYGTNPYVVNIEEATIQNNTFRTALWTGDDLQVTLMSIDVGDSIGLEIHPQVDQFLRIEQGEGIVRMGDRKENLPFEQRVLDNDAIMVPKGTWHNVINTGNTPLKLYSIYAPPEHPFGTVHQTKADAMAEE
ncbi:cupin domain-containing protein [Ornithinibacillus caprae]|uniref:cupin domain-containing protein n=1 Tax=Ornithinibacillus caprae TaxID=2678566 RepID=UPI003CCDB9CD